MTDCYVCGHPILEGQKSEEHAVWRQEGGLPEYLHFTGEFVHLNPADHLPTLTKERERAAKIVEESFNLGASSDEISRTEVLQMLDKIRNGD